MTSNIGSSFLLDGIDENGDIKEENQNMVMNELRGHFRPEFLNRLDEIVMFKPLTRENIGGIVDLIINNLNKRLADRELKIELTDAAKKYVADNGYDPVYGARPLRRAIQNEIEDMLSEEIIDGNVKSGDSITVDVEDDKFTVKK